MAETPIVVRPTHTRHVVLALIVAAYMITYMDRVNIASAVPVIQKDMGFSMITIGWIFASFRWGYAFFQIPGGWLGDRIGGRMPFFVFGLIGLGWSALWYWYYRDTPGQHSRINLGERRLIEDSIGIRGAGVHSVPWRRILRSPSLWTLSLMYFCYGYSIDIYLDWFPKYLNEHRGFNLTQMGIYASLPLFAGAAGD